MTGKISFLLTSVFFLSHQAVAVTFQIQSLCSESYTLNTDIIATTDDSVGGVTIRALDRSGLPYSGSAEGIVSINNSPTGDGALEVISPTHMRAYGWCYSINGVEPNAMPNEVSITNNNDHIKWYYGFAEYKDGDWITYCTPTHLARPAFICHAETEESE